MAGGLGGPKSGGLTSSGIKGLGGNKQAQDTDHPLEPAPPEKTVEECLADLDAMVGLTDVKQQVRRFLAMQQANEVRAKAGLPVVPLSLHLVFTGDPGTGKTTVARIVSELYRAAQLLPNGSFVETDRSGLVAGYVGQTALKVNEILDQADGGVLFIDEAYSLYQGAGNDFGDEAVAALVKGMEDRRERLAVIVSGYEEEMKRFLDSNPGLRSRFQTQIHFPNYSPDELLTIFNKMCDDMQVGVHPNVVNTLSRHFEEIDSGGSRGNGRYVRNLFESMYSRMALAAAADGSITDTELSTFTEEHLPPLGDEKSRQRLGFI